MKNPRFLFLLLFLLPMLNTQVMAQGNANDKTGKIEIPINGTVTAVQGDYTLTQTAPGKLSLTITPRNAFQLSARITDANGKVLRNAISQQLSAKHTFDIDITSLGAGNYAIELYGDNYQHTQRIPFTR